MSRQIFVQFKLEGGTVIESYTPDQWVEVNKKLGELDDFEHFWARSSRHNVESTKKNIKIYKNPTSAQLDVIKDLVSDNQEVGDGIKSYWKFSRDPPPIVGVIKEPLKEGDGFVIPLTPAHFNGDIIKERAQRVRDMEQKLPVQPKWEDEEPVHRREGSRTAPEKGKHRENREHKNLHPPTQVIMRGAAVVPGRQRVEEDEFSFSSAAETRAHSRKKMDGDEFFNPDIPVGNRGRMEGDEFFNPPHSRTDAVVLSGGSDGNRRGDAVVMSGGNGRGDAVVMSGAPQMEPRRRHRESQKSSAKSRSGGLP